MDAAKPWSVEVEQERIARRLLPAIAPGPVLVIGCGDGRTPLLLAGSGFAPVDAVDFSPSVVVKCRELADAAGLPITVRQAAIESLELPGSRYALVIVAPVLHRLEPDAGDRLLQRLQRATLPCGVVIVAVLTTSDPECARLRAAGSAVARHTYTGGGAGALRYYAQGEVDMAFEGWAVLHSLPGRYADPDSEDGYRGAAVVAARRPPTGTLLA